MRRCADEQEVRDTFPLVQSEALKAFGCGDIFIEKFLEEPKHIEVQILADQYGNIVHLFERDCSLQRRYQKVVEFTPAFAISQDIREKICEDAVKIAKDVGGPEGRILFYRDESQDSGGTHSHRDGHRY